MGCVFANVWIVIGQVPCGCPSHVPGMVARRCMRSCGTVSALCRASDPGGGGSMASPSDRDQHAVTRGDESELGGIQKVIFFLEKV